MRKFKIDSKNIITDDSIPYMIAEIGVNHEGSLEKAKELIDLAKEGGAHAAKFQSYKAHTLASKNSPSYWDLSKEPTTSQFELFKKYDSFGEAEYIALYEHCVKVGIDFLSTPFDDESIEFLFPLMKLYKIASADLTNVPFLRKIAKKKKPVILSTGASNLVEIDHAVRELYSHGCEEIALLHCVLNYPTPPRNANLDVITTLRKLYPELIIGYSDHVKPESEMMCVLASYMKGARIIEKHFTHDKSLPGNDHYHAMNSADLKRYYEHLSYIRELNGTDDKSFLKSEELSRANARRSIVVKGNIKANTVLTEDMLTYKRPAHGISPLYWDDVIGKKTKIDLEDDHILKWSDLI